MRLWTVALIVAFVSGAALAAQPHYITAYDGTLQGSWTTRVWDDIRTHVNTAAPAPGRTGNSIEVWADPGLGNFVLILEDVKEGNSKQWKYINEMRTVEFDIYLEPDSTGAEDIQLWPVSTLDVHSTVHLVDLISGWASKTNAQRYGQWFHIVLDLTQWQPALKAVSGITIANWGTGSPHYRVTNVQLGWTDDTTPPVLSVDAPTYDANAHQLSLSFTTNEPTICAIEYGIGAYDTRTWSDNSRNWKSFDPANHQNLDHTAVLPDLIPGATYQYRIIAMDHRTDPASIPNRATFTNSFTVPGPPYTPPQPPVLTYIDAYNGSLVGDWIRWAWEQNGPLFTDLGATAPGRTGNAMEVRFDPVNEYEAFGLADKHDGWINQWHFFNEFHSLEFDINFDSDSTGHDQLQFFLNDTGLADEEPYITDLIPGWIDMSPSDRVEHWFHVSVNLQKIKPNIPAFSAFLLYNDMSSQDGATTHFHMTNVKLGWSHDNVPPVVTLDSGKLSYDYQQFTLAFGTNEPAVCQIGYGIGDYSHTAQSEPNGWQDFDAVASPYTTHSVVLTGLTPNTTYQYRIVAADHQTDASATPNQGTLTGTFTVPPIPTTPPSLSPITTGDITGNRATVCWTAERPATAVVTYQKTGGQVITRTISTYANSQSIVLDLIEPLTSYTVSVAITDAFNFTSTRSTTFTTSASAAPTVTINADSAHPHPISPWIYGINGTSTTGSFAFGRVGGNRWTAYNWENNASNAGNDYFYENDDYLGGGDTPGEAMRGRIADFRARGMASMITIPMLGYVAADKNGPVDVFDPNHLASRFKQLVFRKGSAFTATPSTTDPYVYADEFVWAFRGLFPGDIYGDPATPTFISLDNEPDIWFDTHAEINPNQTSSDVYIQKTIDLSNAIKDVAPNSVIFAPAHWGFNGFVNWQNEPGFPSNIWFTDKYLLAMKAASQTAGRRLIDVYDTHWYAAGTVPGTGQAISNLKGATLSNEEIDALVQNPRSLWDTTYQEDSWITGYLGTPIYILKRLQDKIDADWPGTKLAITEYNAAGDNHIAGTIAQADYLGIFGQMGVFAANLWPMSDSFPFIIAGFTMYRNYDGNLGSFGDISVPTTSSDTSKVVAYISHDSSNPNRHVIVALNRSFTSQDVAFSGISVSGSARVFRLQDTQTTPVFVGEVPADLSNWVVTLPPLSVSTIEIIAPALTPLETWRLAKFGSSSNSGTSADTAMPAGDGIANLMKYALNLEPFTPSTLPMSADKSTGYLRLNVTKNPAATDLVYTVEISGDLTNPNAWTTTGTTVEIDSSTTLSVRDSLPISTGTRRFMRLRVSRP